MTVLGDRLAALSGERRVRLLARLVEAGRLGEIPNVVPPRDAEPPRRARDGLGDLLAQPHQGAGVRQDVGLLAGHDLGRNASALVHPRLHTDCSIALDNTRPIYDNDSH